MACILPYPSQEDIQKIHQAVGQFLQTQTGANRDNMLVSIRKVLDRYHISKFHLDNFSVHRTITPGLAYIKGKKTSLDHRCPGCGADIYLIDSPVRILGIQEGTFDHVTYGCGCGQIFFRFEKK